jgi:hypothetical protein
MHWEGLIGTRNYASDEHSLQNVKYELRHTEKLMSNGVTRLHKQSFQCTQYAHYNDCTNRR